MQHETHDNGFSSLHIDFDDLRRLSACADKIDVMMHNVLSEAQSLLQQTGEVPPEAEAALTVLESGEWRHAIWMLIGALVRRRTELALSESGRKAVYGRSASESETLMNGPSSEPEQASHGDRIDLSHLGPWPFV